jgi:D-alanine-D-alanine ligase
MAERRIRVAVIFGGRSGEHPVSCISAASVLANLDPDRFDVTAIGITPAGRWLQVDPATVPALVGGPDLPAVTDGTEVVLRPDTESGVLGVPGRDGTPALDVQVVFPLLHGPYGEDGTIQGLLELIGLPYVGPGVLASAAAMDKEFTKKLLVAAGLPVAPSAVLRPGTDTLSPTDRDRLGLPVFVKPARAGSSLGVSRVDAWSDLGEAVASARRHDPKVLVEAAMPGREIECGVLEFPDGRVEASPTAEIHVSGEGRFYDFEAKYTDSVASFDIPAVLDEPVTKAVRDAAVRAFRALDAQGLARVDFFVGDDGAVTVNEVNTMPGFTPMSMYPRMWQAAGLSYPDLLSTLVQTARARGVGLR